jgi:hypothetical protein
MLSNIWNHPQTSIAGLLIGIATIAGVLSGQGVTLGNIGTGTVVTLIAGIATALLGLLAKDPGSLTIPPASGPQKLGALLLIFILLSPLAGCNAVSTSTPTAPIAPAQKALNVLAQVQADVAALQAAETAAVKAGLIDAAIDVKIQAALKQEAIDATAVSALISSAAAPATIQAKVDSLLADFQADVSNGALAIKDAKTQATIIAAIAAAEIAVNGIMSAYAGN